MNIGIDIDGVITNLDFLSVLGKKEPILDREKKATVNTPVARKILFHCIKLYSKHGVIRTNASKYINALKNNGHKIFIITKRRFTDENSAEGEKIRTLVKLFLLDRDIPYDEIIFCNGDKLPTIKEKNIDIMIEDSPKNSKSIAESVRVIIFHTPYNTNVEHPQITRLFSWEEIYNYIEGLSKQKGKVYEKNQAKRS